MNDFTLVSCNCCSRELMRANFSSCVGCDKLACAHTEENCGIDCPECDWFVCANCILTHAQSCWATSKVTTEDVPGGKDFVFYQAEKLKLDSRVQVFANDQGITRVRVLQEPPETK